MVTLSSRTLLPADARTRLAGDAAFGGGNVWHAALAYSRAPDAPAIIADRPVVNADGAEQAEFSLAELGRLADAWSAWYIDRGVRPRDRVIVYIEDSFENHLHLAAIAQTGAIPVLINGRMDPDLALGLMHRTGPVGLFTDAAHRELLRGCRRELPATLRWTCGLEDAGVLGSTALPEADRYRHGEDDPVFICHSSGTTGNPKPVTWSHRQSVSGARFRLSTHPEAPGSVMLTAAPQSHSSAIAFTFYALLAGLPLICSSDQSPEGVARAAATYRPTTILAFNHTFAGLAVSGPDPAAFASVEEWMNVGDSAHEAHVRPLIELGRHVVDGQQVPGSVFGDGLGSSELGWAALRRVYAGDFPSRPRYLGKAVPIGEVAVLRADGSVADTGEVGMLGVRSEATFPGYWNDSDTYYRGVLGGYWLSGDLVYRDEQDDYFHVDRADDMIRAEHGPGYSLLMEEVLLASLTEVADCAVVAGCENGTTVPVAVVRPRTAGVDPADLLARANAMLGKSGQPELTMLEVASSARDIPVGPTGKVLKHRLRERYADLPAYLKDKDARSVAVS